MAFGPRFVQRALSFSLTLAYLYARVHRGPAADLASAVRKASAVHSRAGA